MPDLSPEVAAVRDDLVRYGNKLVADRLVIGAAGNISVRVGGDIIVMTPSGLNYDQVTAESGTLLTKSGTVWI